MGARNRHLWNDRSEEEELADQESRAGGTRLAPERPQPLGRRRPLSQGHKTLEHGPKTGQRPTDTAVGRARPAPLPVHEDVALAVQVAPAEDRAALLPAGLEDHLHALRAELQAKLERLEDESRDVDEDTRPRYSNHPADEAVALLDRVGRDAIARVLREDMVQIERALDRVAEGRYGLCEDCHQPIPPKRLEVRPTATLCVSCQAQREARAARNRPMTH